MKAYKYLSTGSGLTVLVDTVPSDVESADVLVVNQEGVAFLSIAGVEIPCKWVVEVLGGSEGELYFAESPANDAAVRFAGAKKLTAVHVAVCHACCNLFLNPDTPINLSQMIGTNVTIDS